jgi:hypothetical protein
MTEIYKCIDGFTVIEYEKTNIFVIENILDDSFCDEFIHLIDTLPLIKYSYTEGNNVNGYATTIEYLIATDDEFFYSFTTEQTKYEEMLDSIQKKKRVSTNKLGRFTKNDIEKYNVKIQEKMLLIHTIMLQINNLSLEYNAGYILRKIYGKTRNHFDGINEIYTSNVSFIQNNKIGDYRMIRNASVIFTLNDDYDGGKFHFPYHNISIKLKKGSVLIFPPYWTHPHETEDLENGTFRYTISTWACHKI